MNSDRIKEIQETTAYPESTSVKRALLQVWNECEQELKSDLLNPVIGFLTLRQVAYKYGEKISCEVVCPEGVEWKRTELIVSEIFLKQMEQGSIRNCR